MRGGDEGCRQRYLTIIDIVFALSAYVYAQGQSWGGAADISEQQHLQ